MPLFHKRVKEWAANCQRAALNSDNKAMGFISTFIKAK
jgi:hypothetical protein